MNSTNKLMRIPSTTLLTLLVMSNVDAFFSPISMRTPTRNKEPNPKCPIQSIKKRMTKITGNPESTGKIHLKPGLGFEEGDYGDDKFGLERMYFYLLQLPVHVFKIPFAIVLGIWSSLLWRAPTEEDVVNSVEGTSLINVLHRDMSDLSVIRKGEERNYFVDVKDCHLVHTNTDGVVNNVESWEMRYTKTRPQIGRGKWDIRIHSFKVNGEVVTDPARMISFIQMYTVLSTHVKCHVYGNALTRIIKKYKKLRIKLSNSTLNTIWLHNHILNGVTSPVQPNKWFGSVTIESLLEEADDMSSLGGCKHSTAKRWVDLDLPLSTFMLKARVIIRKAMADHDIPMELHEAIFLSVVVHSSDHILARRLQWGLKFGMDPWEKDYGNPLICESSVWNFIFLGPTLNPLFNNKIKNIRKPFYRQLYQELKKIDMLDVVDEITASIMY